MQKQYIIYKLTNLITNEIYIGQTQNLKARICKYKNLSCKSQKLLYTSIKKYKWENFEFKILTKTNLNFVNNTETFYINFYNSFYKNNFLGLNMTITGRASFRGHKHTKERNEKLSLLLKGKYSGKKLSEEHKRKISENHSCLGKFGKDHHRSKKIYQYDSNGKYLKMFYGLSDAARNLKVNPSSISAGIKEKCKIKNFYWSYEKTENFIFKIKIRKLDIYINCKFNYLTVVSFSKSINNKNYYLCQCDCGKIKELHLTEVIRNNPKSCGCFRKKYNFNKLNELIQNTNERI